MNAHCKAIELINRYGKLAILIVTEIINANPNSNPFNTDVYSTMSYWLDVKKEIENYEN